MQIKKLLSIVIVLALCFSITVVSAAENENQLEFFKAFSLVDSGTASNDVLTRGELAKIYYKLMLKTDEIPEGDTVSRFTDVPESLASVAEAVSGAGIMTGTGDGKFEPDKNVTYIQLIKTMISFLGYDTVANYYGGYPTGYYNEASLLGLTKKAPSDYNFYVTYGGAENVFRAAVKADIMQNINGNHEIVEGKNYLSLYYGILEKDGIVTEDNFSDMDNNKSDIYGRIRIDSEPYDVGEGAKNIIYEGGKKVRIFYTLEDARPFIYFYEQIRNTETIINGEDITNVSSDAIEYYNGSKTTKIKYNAKTAVVYNGAAVASYNSSILNPFDKYDGYIKAIDNDGDKIADALYISAYKSMVVGSVRGGKVYSKIRTGQFINLKELGEAVIINTYNEQISSSDIAVGDILTYETDLSGKVTKVNVTIDVGGGIISDVETKASGEIASVIISGRSYSFGKTANQSKDISDVQPGKSIVLYFNRDGRVGDFEIEATTGVKTGYITAAKKDKGISGVYRVKILTSKGIFETFELADKISIDNDTFKPEEFITKLGVVSSGDIVRQAILYTLDENGKLTSAVLSGGEGLHEVKGLDGTTEINYKTSLNSFRMQAYAGSDTIVFIIPPEENRSVDEAYSVEDYSYFGNSGYKVLGYSSEENDPLLSVAIVESEAGAVTDLDSTGNYLAVDKIVKVIDDEGNVAFKIYGAGRYNANETKNHSFTVLNENVLKIGKDGSMPEQGDIIKYAVDVTGKMSAAKLILDKSENKLYDMQNPNYPTFPADGSRYTYGKIIKKTGSYITAELINTDSSKVTESYPIFRFDTNGMYFLSDNKGDGKYTTLNESYIYDSETFGDDASYVFTFTRGEWWYGGIIYTAE